MATPIKMPKLGDSIGEGVLSAWLIEEGDRVSAGVVLAHVETEKATMDLEAFDDGILLKKVVEEGERVKIGDLIGVIGSPGEDIAPLLSEAGLDIDEIGTGANGSSGQGALSTDYRGGDQSGSVPFDTEPELEGEGSQDLCPGYVYVLVNPAFGLNKVKIGLTTREPEERVRELSRATGVPEPFTLVYKAKVPDCREIERRVHERLSVSRINPNREFFGLEPHRAVAIVNREVVRQVFGT